MGDKFKLNFSGTKVEGSYDGDNDGSSSAKISIELKEVYEELMAKGEAKVDAVISFKRVGGKISVLVDTDKDGEAVVDLELDLIEGLKEAF